ncbi:MAG: 1-deoxy-D-xylulose-5-phosphate reductoisomerase, partial [Methanomicrobia archaeon]|nr:1-deoxy-D-xylulose-5-phosphate reductoisomerase [Methanomicrobia archaeon]
MEFISMTSLLLLGASGSIGEQALQIIENDPKRFQLLGISLGKRIDGIDAILARFPSIKEVCVRYAYDAEMLRAKHPERIFYDGDDGLVSLIEAVKPKMVINALVGFVGLVPTITALNLNIDVALATKETLVVGGEMIK